MPRPSADTATDDLMMRQFRAFYEDVLRTRDRASEALDTTPETAAQAVERHLENLLELQTLESRRESTRFELDHVADARYLKAAVADEILLHTPWIGRDHWTTHLLEASLFRTNIAGDLVFSRIEQLLSEREPSRRDLARLYLFTLALGFQGRYRGGNDTSHLQELREALYQFVYQRPADLAGRDRVLSEHAYAHTLSHLAPSKMPTMSRWNMLFLAALVALLAISELLWLWQSWPVRQALRSAAATTVPGPSMSLIRDVRPC